VNYSVPGTEFKLSWRIYILFVLLSRFVLYKDLKLTNVKSIVFWRSFCLGLYEQLCDS
jgi:hypothetical protein